MAMTGSKGFGTGTHRRSSMRIAPKNSIADPPKHASPFAALQLSTSTPTQPRSSKISVVKRINIVSPSPGLIEPSPKRAKTSKIQLPEPSEDGYTSDGSTLSVLSNTPEPPEDPNLRPRIPKNFAPEAAGRAANITSPPDSVTSTGLGALTTAVDVPPNDKKHPGAIADEPSTTTNVRSHDLLTNDGRLAMVRGTIRTSSNVVPQANGQYTSASKSRSGRITKKPLFYGDMLPTPTAAVDGKQAPSQQPNPKTPACRRPASKRQTTKAMETEKRPRRRPQRATKPTASEASLIPHRSLSKLNRHDSLSRGLVTLKVNVPQQPKVLPRALPTSQSSDVDHSQQEVDPKLVELSQALLRREPLDTKQEPQGQPLVWADSRQELCETLPYFKAYHGGCYAKDGTAYSFLLDGIGGYREYMDQDIVIARAGGGMTLDKKAGKLLQSEQHRMNDSQPQAVLNSIAQRNPLIFICGDRNTAAPSKLPHRYCVLDWFKPALVWSEKTVGVRGKIFNTVKYKFERLDGSKASWFAPLEAERLPTSDVPQLKHQTCGRCGEHSPQIYLIEWICLNGDCLCHWKLTNGEDASYGELDFNPAFLFHRSAWKDHKEPFSVKIPPPELGGLLGDNLRYANICGVICPKCGRCNSRYLFQSWKCDTQGCAWKLVPQHQPIRPQNLQHRPWDIPCSGPGLVLANRKSVVKVDVRFTHGYKVLRYTIEGIKGCVIVAKANQKSNAELMGPDDMFRELQTEGAPLERRRFSKGSNTLLLDRGAQSANRVDDENYEQSEDIIEEYGNRMNAFSMNGGFPYKFATTADSYAFEDCPLAMRACRSRLNWAQRVFLNDPNKYQEFNEELVFAYMEGQKIKYHDDGEKGLGPTIASTSLGGSARMSLRLKAKYFSGVSKQGLLTDEHPLPFDVLLSSAETESGWQRLRNTYANRVTAWEELQKAKAVKSSDTTLAQKSRELASNAGLKRRVAKPLLSFTLAHGDIMIMHGEQIQKLLEHEVVPEDLLRFALTCRTILSDHLAPGEFKQQEVKADDYGYDGSSIKEPGDLDALMW